MSEPGTTGVSVRIGGKAYGPLSADELRELAGLGAVTPATPVSKDGRRWVEARNVRGLAFAAPARLAPAAAPPPPAGSPGRITAGTVAAVAALAGLTVSILGCGVFGLLFRAGGASAPGDAAELSASPAEILPAGPTPGERLAERTLAYWDEFRGVLRDAAAAKSAGSGAPREYAASLRRTSARLRGLPAAAADPDAVSCVIEVADGLDEMAGHAERATDPTYYLEAFVRSANGDTWGPTADALAANAQLRRRVEAVGRKVDAARALLSARHGVEFPPLR